MTEMTNDFIYGKFKNHLLILIIYIIIIYKIKEGKNEKKNNRL